MSNHKVARISGHRQHSRADHYDVPFANLHLASRPHVKLCPNAKRFLLLCVLLVEVHMAEGLRKGRFAKVGSAETVERSPKVLHRPLLAGRVQDVLEPGLQKPLCAAMKRGCSRASLAQTGTCCHEVAWVLWIFFHPHAKRVSGSTYTRQTVCQVSPSQLTASV